MKNHQISFVDYYEEAKYLLTYRLSLLLAIVLPVLVITYFFNKDTPIYPSLIGGAFGLFSVIYLKRRPLNYRPIAKSWAIIAGILNVFSVVGITNVYHFADAFWMVNAALFTYFTLGWRWGLATILINVVTLASFVFIYLNGNIESLETQDMTGLFGLFANVIVGGGISAYLLNQFVKVNEFTKTRYEKANDAIQIQYDTILAQNDEKTLMLKEIHHRVKNNLQVITSLLRLQSREFEDENARAKFKESINRVGAMALIHERMYQSKDLSKINVSNYVTSLINDLIASYSVSTPVEISVDSTIQRLGNKTIVPFALIINELASNSLKHGLKFVNKGKIDIKIHSENDLIQFDYQDNGRWIEPNKDTSFGLELIDVLTDQLDGNYERSTEEGTSYSFQLKNIDDTNF